MSPQNIKHSASFLVFLNLLVSTSFAQDFDGAELTTIHNNETAIIPSHDEFFNHSDVLDDHNILVAIRDNLTRYKVQSLSPAKIQKTEFADDAGNNTNK